MRARPAYAIALVVVAAWGAQSYWARAHRAARDVAWTSCPFFGEPVVTMLSDIAPWDTLPTRVHEETHAQQCRDLGPVKYRVRSLTSAGRLSAEVPAFCAAAAGRLTQDVDSQYASDRLHTDMIEGLADVADSNRIKSALMQTCPAIASQPRRTRGGFKAPRSTPGTQQKRR